MSLGVVGGVALPASPDDATDRASEGAQRPLVVVPAATGVGVAVSGPRVPHLGGVREDGQRFAQAFVARPAEGRVLAFAGLDGDGGLAGVGSDRVAVGVAGAAVADLGQQGRGADDRVAAAKERTKDLPVGVRVKRTGDLGVEIGDLGDHRLERAHERQHDLPASRGLDLFGAPGRRLTQALEQLHRRRAVVVAVSPQERRQALLAEPAGVRGAGVALQERERDRAGQMAEESDRRRPEPLKLRAQLVAHRHPRFDEVLAGARERAQRLGLVAVGLKDPEAMSVSARQLTQHEAIKPIRLAARGAKPIPRRLDLIGMQRQHPHPSLQQPIDQQPVRALNRDQVDLKARQRRAQAADPVLAVRERRGQQLLPGRVLDQHIVLLRRPFDPRAVTHRLPPAVETIARCLDPEVPFRVLIDMALTRGHVLSPLAAPHHRPGRVSLLSALARASSHGPVPTAVETTQAWPISSKGTRRHAAEFA